LEADGSVNNWANNRLFVVVESETDWESRPEKVLGRLKRLVGDLGEPLKVRVAKSIIRCQVVPISL
jgi:hypothetical protein